MSSGRDEVEAAVNPGVWDHLLPRDTQLLVQVLVKLLIDMLQNGCPARRGRRGEERWEERGGGGREERERGGGRGEGGGGREERGGGGRRRCKIVDGTYWYTKYASRPPLSLPLPSPPSPPLSLPLSLPRLSTSLTIYHC